MDYRKVLAEFMVDGDAIDPETGKPIEGIIEHFCKECVWMEQGGVELVAATLVDDDEDGEHEQERYCIYLHDWINLHAHDEQCSSPKSFEEWSKGVANDIFESLEDAVRYTRGDDIAGIKVTITGDSNEDEEKIYKSTEVGCF